MARTRQSRPATDGAEEGPQVTHQGKKAGKNGKRILETGASADTEALEGRRPASEIAGRTTGSAGAGDGTVKSAKSNGGTAGGLAGKNATSASANNKRTTAVAHITTRPHGETTSQTAKECSDTDSRRKGGGQERATSTTAEMTEAEKDAHIKRLEGAVTSSSQALIARLTLSSAAIVRAKKRSLPEEDRTDGLSAGDDGRGTKSNSKRRKKRIKPIPKPRGTAGEGDFNLQRAMKLADSPDRVREYNAILNDVHRMCARYGIDAAKGSFKQQDQVRLGKLFKMMFDLHPYLNPERFPAHWATAAMVKQYVNGQRKAAKRKERQEKQNKPSTSTARETAPELIQDDVGGSNAEVAEPEALRESSDEGSDTSSETDNDL